jgi:hypothetical protein
MTSDRVFAIGMTDYVEFVLLPPLFRAILRTKLGSNRAVRTKVREVRMRFN